MRLDIFLAEKGLCFSRNKAKECVERGEVCVNGKTITKASFSVSDNDEVVFTPTKNFVSLGGYKLDKALDDFDFSVKDFVVIDVGASTGGFTDCILQRGAKKVFAVDLNDGLLHEKLKNDKRVIPIIKNARYLNSDDISEKADLIVADLSFISATMILPVISKLAEINSSVILLIKPQFECDKKTNFKNGIIKDAKIRKKAVEKIIFSAMENGFYVENLTKAPVYSDKNVEYLVLLKKKGDNNGKNAKSFEIDTFDF